MTLQQQPIDSGLQRFIDPLSQAYQSINQAIHDMDYSIQIPRADNRSVSYDLQMARSFLSSAMNNLYKQRSPQERK